MEDISKTNALSLFSKWERQNQLIVLLCLTDSFVLSSNTGRLSMCLDEYLDLSLADGTQLRLFLSEAAFSRVGPGDLSAEPLHDFFPRFEEGVHVNCFKPEMRCYLLARLGL
jgi:hypothetical protein